MRTVATSHGGKCRVVDMMAFMAPPIDLCPGRGESFGSMTFVFRGLMVAFSTASA